MSLNLLWILLFTLWVLSEIVLVLRTHTARTGGQVQDRGSLRILWITITLSIIAGFWSPAFAPAATLHHVPWLRPLAILLLIAGLVIRWIAILSLGRAFSVNVAIRPGQQIYRQGLYRHLRHPSYSGLLLIFLAIGLSTHNLAGIAIVVLPTCAALLHRIRIEEQALHAAFGTAYAEYARTAARLIPFLY